MLLNLALIPHILGSNYCYDNSKQQMLNIDFYFEDMFMFKFFIIFGAPSEHKPHLVRSKYGCPLGCPKNIKNVFFLPHILHEAAFIPKKEKPKEIKSFQTFVLRGRAFSFYKGNPKNIQRKICMRTVLAVISHKPVQSI